MGSYNDKELLIYDKDDKFVTILSSETGLIETMFKDYENHISDEAFTFTINNSAKYDQGYSTSNKGENNLTQVAGSYVGILGEDDVDIVKNVSPIEFVKEENQVLFRDRDDVLRLMRIKEIYERVDSEGALIDIVCEASYLELYDNFIEDRRFTDKTPQFILDALLTGSRYVGDVTVDLGLVSTNFYWIDSIEALWDLLDKAGGALKDSITLNDKNEIVERKLSIVNRLGSDKGLIVESNYNAESIERNTLSYPATALWAQGSSLEIEDEDGELTGGNTKYITFENIVWSKANGDPTDKEKGQKFVGDEEARLEYGYLNDDGERIHRFQHYSNQDIEDEEELLEMAWMALQTQKLSEISHEATIFEADKHVSLGDSATIISREYNKPIEVQSQVSGLEYDLLDPNEMLIVLGKYLDLSEDPLQKEVDDLKDAVKNPPSIGSGGGANFPDTKPIVPQNITATGAFRTIVLSWDWVREMYVNRYEVYGSQNPDFVPDSQFLLFAGDVSGYSHEVKTDEKWHYYVRAVNTHGTAGEFTERLSASTVRIINDDILFGEDIAQDLRDLDKISGIIGDGTIDLGNLHESLPDHFKQQAKEYTDAEVLETKNELIGDIADKVDAEWVNGQLVSKADSSDLDIVEGRVENNESALIIHDDEILARVTKEDYTIDQDDIITDITLNESNIMQNANKITSKVEQKTYNKFTDTARDQFSRIDQTFDEIRSTVSDIVIGTGNLFENSVPSDNSDGAQIDSNSPVVVAKTKLGFFSKGDYVAQIQVLAFTPDEDNPFEIYVVYVDKDEIEHNTTAQKFNAPGMESAGQTNIIYKFSIPEEALGIKLMLNNLGTKAILTLYNQQKLEQGHDETEWKPSLEDFEGRMVKAESNITQNADNINLKVDVDGIVSAINLDEEGVRIQGDLIELDGLTLIEEGIIQTAHIENAAITRLKLARAIIGSAQIEDAVITRAKIKDAAIDSAKIAKLAVTDAKIDSLDVDKITGKVSDFVMSKWNSINLEVQVSAEGLSTFDIYSGALQRTSLLNRIGHTFYNTNVETGVIGTQKDGTRRGLAFNLARQGDYMTWGYDQFGTGAFVSKLDWNKNGNRSIPGYINSKGFLFHDDVSIHPDNVLRLDRISTMNWNDGNRYIDFANFSVSGTDGVVIRRTSNGGKLFISMNGASLMSANNNGRFEVGSDSVGGYVKSATVWNRRYSSGESVIITGGNAVLAIKNSSRRYKINEQEFDLNYSKRMLNVKPKSWFDKEASENFAHTLTTGNETEPIPVEKVVGNIAEDYHDAGLSEFVKYENGLPDRINENGWILYSPMIEDLYSLDDEKEKRINQLEEEVKELKYGGNAHV